MAVNHRTPPRIAAVLAWCWLICCALPAFGGGRYCVVDGWGTGEGLLPQSSIISMIQTRDGYLWLGTLNGLVRFDGVHFTVFDESSTPNLSSIQTVKLFEDSRTNLWIGTASAGEMIISNGQVFKFDFAQSRRQGHVVSICQDSAGSVWLLSEDRKLARYASGSIDVWNIAGGDYDRGRSVIAEKSGLVWVGADHSLFAIDPATVHSKETLREAATAPVGKLDFLLASRNGGHWRLADGIIDKCFGAKVERTLGQYPWAGSDAQVKAACEDREGNLIIGTLGAGVYWFDSQGRATHICETNGLAFNSVLSMVMDSEGSLWVGLDGGGKSQKPLNRIMRSFFNLMDSSAGQDVQSISADNKGGIWFSSTDHDLCYCKNGVSQHVGSIGGLNPKAVLVDTNQEVWAATMGGGLYRLIGEQFVLAPGSGDFNHYVSALYQGHHDLWVGTEGGAILWNGQQWKVFETNRIVRAIADDAAGDVWIGTEHGGLDLLRGGKFITFQKTNGFPTDNISCLYLDDRGVLWIGTTGNGLVRLGRGEWKHYTTQNGLTGNSIDYVLEDDAGFLWIGSNAGLMRVKKRDLDNFNPNSADFLSCRGYDTRDGLPTTECTYGSQPAACKTTDGVLWFPTIAGLVSVNPSDIRPNTNPPPVVIEAVVVNQQAQSTNGLRMPPPESVTVPAGKENLEIQYTSLNLAAADRALFRYQLEGFQSVWTLAGKARFARYLHLPHGKYRFEVQARNEDGVWNETGASLDVIVLPPFWETWWFRAAAAGALLGIIIATVHFISTQKLQRQLVGLRQQQALEKERARIARDIHDQVGASLTQLSILGEMVQADKDRPEETDVHARQISQTARETARELDEIVWTVNPSNDSLDSLITYICKNAQDYLAVAGLRYRLDVPAQLPAATITPEARHNVFLAAKESVTNVVRHAHASEAWLRLRLAPQSFTLEIEDNGRGPGGIHEKAAQSRNGLRNMRKRMEDIGGEFFIGPGQQGGTLVRLTVPLRNR